ncbi:MAG: hypothetical protein COX16_03570 [Deltaproteobacteria bacterium CG23_combo_of_CG06-09_8_20_14_all_51_20]|nr:MAG: hypothetical protein COX16_03570 [Deltaproteobacteria bacterium CG23_combo_of_CG06-09_8_20_14_all_51_20]
MNITPTPPSPVEGEGIMPPHPDTSPVEEEEIMHHIPTLPPSRGRGKGKEHFHIKGHAAVTGLHTGIRVAGTARLS